MSVRRGSTKYVTTLTQTYRGTGINACSHRVAGHISPVVYLSLSVLFWRGCNTNYLCFEGQTGSDSYDEAKLDTDEGPLAGSGVLQAAGRLPRA